MDPQRRAKELTDEEIAHIANILDREALYGGRPVAPGEIHQNIDRLKAIGCYRGLRHRKSLPSAATNERGPTPVLARGHGVPWPARRASRNSVANEQARSVSEG